MTTTTTRQLVSLAVVVLGVFIDVAISLLSLGFYNERSAFEFDAFVGQLSLSKFSFLHTLHEFVFLLIFRSIYVLIGVVIRWNTKNGKKFKPRALVVFGVATVTWSFMLIKILAISETKEQLRYAGLWMCTAWTILGTGGMVTSWILILPSEKAWPLQAQAVDANSDQAPLISEDEESTGATAKKKEQEISRKSGLIHMWRLIRYCKYGWKWFLLGFIFLTIYSIARIFIPQITSDVINTVVSDKSQGKEGMTSLVTAVIKMTALVCISSVFGGLRGGCFTYASMIVNCRMRCDLFRSLMKQEIAFYDTTKTGEITSRLTSDCQTMATTVATNLNVFMRNGLMLIGALVYMFYLSWQLTLVTFIAVPLVGFITKVYGAYYDTLSERTQKALADANHVAEQTLSTMRTVRSFACEEKEAEKFDGYVGETISICKKKSIAYMFYTWLNEGCDNAILVGVLFYGGHLVLSDRMEGKSLITFLLYQMQLGENLYNLGYVFTGLMEAVGASRKVFEYMDREPGVRNDGTLKPEVDGEIEFDNVTFAYPSRENRKILEGLTFKVNPGETVALVGPSGGGKSTCVALLEHFYNLLGGEIRMDGVDIAKIEHHYYHEKIALVAQEPVLYDGTVADNILYGFEGGTEEERKELMTAAARKANVHDFVCQMESGYNTNCGERGVQMSGGQKQRIAIARALVRNPAVLILDEATSALDTESEHIVQEAISQWCQERKTVIIIAHRLSTVEKADKILVISGGKLLQVIIKLSTLSTYSLERQPFGADQGQRKPLLQTGEPTDDGTRRCSSDSPFSVTGALGQCRRRDPEGVQFKQIGG
ncbi:hypothetical protein L596_008119 [Steinernema carpocapsae]|uniref:ABC transmembrane type-1 domain-containing protein n=1 Tax=Steinernema carpocapsae TaxID=34508 RepID=A0A4U5PBG8_STECR|nr:hypothetical protein L596_008119 [Steinernema carpocapsae]